MEFAAGRVRWGLYILRSLGHRGFTRLLGSMLFSVHHYYILGKDLTDLESQPSSNSMRFLDEQEITFLQSEMEMLEVEDKREVLSRLIFYGSGFKNCYAIKDGGNIAFLQWIIYPSDNPVIMKTYSKKFLTLNPRQVMIENAFTFPRYRGRGYLIDGTIQLLQHAKNSGYKWAICYIRKDRITSLNEFCRMGFRIIRIVTEYKFLGHVWRRL